MNAFLQQLVTTDTAHRLALTLKDSLWQGVVVAAVFAIMLHYLRRATAQARYVAACLALVAVVVWPVVNFYRLGPQEPVVIDMPWKGGVLRDVAIAVGAVDRDSGDQYGGVFYHQRVYGPSNPADVWGPGWQSWLVMLWLAGMAVLTVWHAIGWMGLRRLRRAGTQTLAGEFAAVAARLAQRMRLPARVRVFWSERVSGAISFGTWRPVVLLPASMATGFTPEQLAMILAHEFAHLQRHDYLVNLVQTAVGTVLFFHPAVWWINRRIRIEREHACDDAAVRATGNDAPAYARALALLAETTLAAPPRLALAASPKKGGLLGRIERLLKPAPRPSPLRPLSGLAIFAAVVFSLSGTAVTPTKVQAKEAAVVGKRGTIYDRNGVALAVSDRAGWYLVFQLDKLVAAYAAQPGNTLPTVTYHRPRTDGTGEDMMETDVVRVFDKMAAPLLKAGGLQLPDPASAMREHFRKDGGTAPFVYARGLTEAQAGQAAGLKDKIPGMTVREVWLRRYPYKAMACHLLGYMRPDFDGELEHNRGISGVEASLNDSLAPPVTDQATRGTSGADVYLTVDVRYQQVVERVLRDFQPAITRGAVVLLDVNSGDILAMASAPSFDGNELIESTVVHKKGIQGIRIASPRPDVAGTLPMMNRAVTTCVPASTFNVVSALAAICDGKEGLRFDCSGFLTYGSTVLRCWLDVKDGKGHGMQDLRQGMRSSCNPYFYQLGNATRRMTYDATVTLLGLDQKSGLDLVGESASLSPGRHWADASNGKPMPPGFVANAAIGQGVWQVTPLQMAGVMVPVANGGTVWRPRMVDRVTFGGDQSKVEKRPLERAADLRQHGLTESGLTLLRQGLRDVVTDGSGVKALLPDLAIAGKSGTAQHWRNSGGENVPDNQANFIGYAPVEKPRWAICVMTQGSKTAGRSAVPVAAQILEQVNMIEIGIATETLEAMEPIMGRFEEEEGDARNVFNIPVLPDEERFDESIYGWRPGWLFAPWQ